MLHQETKGDAKSDTAPSSNPFAAIRILPPDQIKIQKEVILGKGAFGVVYRGLYGKRLVAIKVLQINVDIRRSYQISSQLAYQQKKEEVWKDLSVEMSLLVSLRHPRIVRFYGCLEGTEPAFVMEYCGAGTLEDRLKLGAPLSDIERWQLALDIAQGLEYAHRRGIVHRDLKPANILLDQQGRAKLADFGVAHVDALLQSEEASAAAKGYKDWAWKAPEEFETPKDRGASESGSPSDPAAIDMYAFGLILWQLVSGQEPHGAAVSSHTAMAAYIAALNGPPEKIPDHCHPEFRALIEACWNKDPNKRFSALDVVQRLEQSAKLLHPQWLLVRATQPSDLLIDEYRDQFEDYLPLRATPSAFEQDPDQDELPVAPAEAKETKEAKEIKESKATPGPGDAKSSLPGKALATESKEVSSASPSRRLPSLDTLWDTFLTDPQHRVLVLFGEGGLGKTLSTYHLSDQLLKGRFALSEKDAAPKPWLPIFIRPGIKHWTYSQLKNGIAQSLKETYKLDTHQQAQLKNQRLLFILDGYDELQADEKAKNLPQQLQLADYPQAKLLITCRREIVPSHDETLRFGFKGDVLRYYLLPLSLQQLLNTLEQRLAWSAEEKERYATRLQEAPHLRTALRNPFVLNLFIQSWNILSRADFQQLTRSGIYAGFIQYWLESHQRLLEVGVAPKLQASAADLITSFTLWAEQIAYQGYQQGILKIPQESVVLSPWLQLKDLMTEAARERHDEREQKAAETKDHHRHFSVKGNYVMMVEARSDQFTALCPLQQRNQQLEFIHKSFWEYFAARYLLRVYDSGEAKAITEAFRHHPIQAERGLLDFLVEALQSEAKQLETRQARAFHHIRASRESEDPAQAQTAANFMTLLNAADSTGLWFSKQRDLRGIRIPGADLSGGVYDNVDFSGADLQRVNLSQTWLREAKLTQTNMTGVQFGELPFLRLRGPVHACAYSPDGQQLAVATEEKENGDNVIIIYDTQTWKEVQVLKGHTDNISCLAYDPHQPNRLASGSWDDNMRVWDVNAAKTLQILSGHTLGVTCLAYDPHQSNRLASSGGWDGSVRVWDVNTAKTLYILSGHTGLVVTCLAYDPYQPNSLASGNWDHTVVIWDISAKTLHILRGHTQWVNCLAYDPHQPNRLASGSHDKSVRVWNISAAKSLHILSGHAGNVMCLAYDPHQPNRLVSGSGNSMRVWDVNAAKTLGILNGHPKSVKCLAYDRYQPNRLVSGSYDNNVRVWDINAAKALHTLSGYTNWVRCLAYDPHQLNRLASGIGNSVQIWDVNAAKILGILNGHTKPVKCLAYDPHQLNRLASSGIRDFNVLVWDISTAKTLHLLKHTCWVECLAYDPHQPNHLAAGNWDASVRIWDISAAKTLQILDENGHMEVECLAYDPHQPNRLASEINSVRVWDLNAAKSLHILRHTDLVECLAYDPHQPNRLASGSTDNNVRVWDISVAKALHTLSGHTNSIRCLAYDPYHPNRLASGSDDQSVRVWDLTNSSCLTVLYFPQKVSALAWSKETFTVAVGRGIYCFDVLRTEHTLSFQLRWLSGPSVLWLQGADIKGAQGLTEAQRTLLEQRDAVIDKPLLLEVKAVEKASQAKSPEKEGAGISATPPTVAQSAASPASPAPGDAKLLAAQHRQHPIFQPAARSPAVSTAEAALQNPGLPRPTG